MGSSYRINRVEELLRRELSDIVQHLGDPRLHMLTVVDVELTRDLKSAKVFVSSLGDQEQQLAATAALQQALGFVRREVAKRISLRQVPQLALVYDDTAERAARVGALLNQVKSNTDG
ncbi:MAG: 30S ribosome-binding factor RbfA [Candidatus Latescibacteria bacterium]|nr:30S ribosome-binding factor RbfA [Candidatus Latescibacterota bacterium]